MAANDWRSGVARRTARWLAPGLGAVVALGLTWGLGGDAAAQTCTAATTVATSAELDAAIACYNAQTPSGDHVITLNGDVVYDAVAGNTSATTIDSSTDSGNLTIQSPVGTRHSIIGPRGADGSLPDVAGGFINLVQIENPGVETRFDRVGVAGSDSRGINLDGGSLVITESDIHHNAVNGVSVFDGVASVVDSTVRHNTFNGVATSSGAATTIVRSTVHDNGADGVSSVGSTLVANSTIAANAEGIDASRKKASRSSCVSAGSTMGRAGCLAGRAS